MFVFSLFCSSVYAQYRAEFVSYDIRAEADGDRMAGSKYYRPLEFRDGVAAVDIPLLWLDREVFVRDPLFSGDFELFVNDRPAVLEATITPLLREGMNVFEVRSVGDPISNSISSSAAMPADGAPEGFYLFSQPRIRVVDFIASGHHDDEVRDAVLDLAVVVRNGYNMPEKITLGYDIYDPAGQLKDFVFRDVTIDGQRTDTVRFYHKVTGTQRYRYTAKSPALYRVTVSVRHGGLHTEYIPFRVGFEAAQMYSHDALVGGGVVFLNAPATKAEYDRWEREGKMIVDCAAIPVEANDPALVDVFLDRQRSMYYRNRNRANIVGWAIGPPVGNGYNMYKSYQWLKSVEPARPVIYTGADGEWNTDER